jgi:hypothetical protein
MGLSKALDLDLAHDQRFDGDPRGNDLFLHRGAAKEGPPP